MTRRIDLVGIVLVIVALLVGLWLGLGAPAVSPVTPVDGPFGSGAPR